MDIQFMKDYYDLRYEETAVSYTHLRAHET